MDYIYGTTNQCIEFLDWCKEHYPNAIKYFYFSSEDEIRTMWTGAWNDGRCHPIASFPNSIDKWMINNCPLDYVVEFINYKYVVEE